MNSLKFSAKQKAMLRYTIPICIAQLDLYHSRSLSTTYVSILKNEKNK